MRHKHPRKAARQPSPKKAPKAASHLSHVEQQIAPRFNAAAKLHNSGERQAAKYAYQKLALEFPEQWACYINLSLIIKKNKDSLPQRLQILRWAMIASGENARALKIYADELLENGDTAQSLVYYHKSLARTETPDANLFKAFGNALFKNNNRNAALIAFTRGHQLAPDAPDFAVSRCHVLNGLGRHQEALDIANAALAKLDHPETEQFGLRNAQAITLVCLGRCAEADALIATWPAHERADIHTITTQARSLMLQGKLHEGWPLLSQVWRHTLGPSPRFPGQPWQGEDLKGKTIVLFCEQGMGDTLQFVRYAPLIAAMGAKVYLYCQVPLKRLLTHMQGVNRVFAQGELLPHVDFNFPMPDLAVYFDTRLTTIPNHHPYITPPKAKRLIDQSFRIGLAWAGNSQHQNDFNRSIQLSQLLPLLEIPTCRFYNFQVGPETAQIEALGLQHLITEPSPLTDFSDTAHALQQVDLLITVDTSIAHLAGAIYMPVWVLLPKAPDWRWLLDRDDTPWYPSMRLFRQQTDANWSAVIARIKTALLQAMAAKQSALPSGP